MTDRLGFPDRRGYAHLGPDGKVPSDELPPGGGGGAASDITFDPSGLDNTSATDVQAAMEDFDAAITAASGGGASFATPAIALGTAAAAGAASTVIRSDATIVAFDATVPVAPGTAAAGAATMAARRDHVHPLTETINFVIDGGGSAIATGIKGDIVLDFACKVVGWVIVADQTGSIVVDIWSDTYANYPPTGADSITTSEKPTLASAVANTDTSLNSGNGWAIPAGNVLRFNVDSATTVTRATVALKIARS